MPADSRRPPLEGIRVLDLSRVLAGPWATQLLADLGAVVTKVERPGTGDDTRAWGPPWLAGEGGRESAYFASANRNKRSIALDFQTPSGREIVRALAAQSDVVVENFKAGGLRHYGLDYASLAALNPALVYCSITGFGQEGPGAGRAGYDLLIQATGGLMSVTGRPDGEPGAGPLKVGVALVDVITGLYASNAILAALFERARSGEGQHIDIALFDVQVAALANQSLACLVTGEAPRRLGNAHPNIVPYEDFPTSDGRVVLAVGNDRQFRDLAAAVGEPTLADDPRFATNAARVAHRTTLVPRLSALTARKPSAEWVRLLEPLGVPCGAVRDLVDVFNAPEAQARGLARAICRNSGEPTPTVANPIRFSRTPVEYRSAPPRLGEHTGEVLRELDAAKALRGS
jgi:crotonobetainyl-CoA:carnitine CoA-transferase CaiB-like acyl-CoA transferase